MFPIFIIFMLMPALGLAFDECISLQVSTLIDETLGDVGQEHLQSSVQFVEKELKIRILERETNPYSLKFLEMGFPSKPMRLKAKTAATGLIAGLVPIDQTLSKATSEELSKFTKNIQTGIQDGTFLPITFERDGFIGVIDSDGNQKWKLKNKITPQDKVIKIVGDAKSGLPFTADLDLAFVTLGPISEKKTHHNIKVLNQPIFGIESEFEKVVREKINTYYHKHIYEGTLTHQKAMNDLVNHGPESRNPAPRPPDYPFQESSGEKIEKGPPNDPHHFFRRYLEKLKKENQDFELPDHWKKELQM